PGRRAEGAGERTTHRGDTGILGRATASSARTAGPDAQDARIMSSIIRPQAADDVDEIAAYLEQRRRGYGQRFHQAVDETFRHLEQMPGSGTALAVPDPTLWALRSHPVRRFPNYFVLYLPLPHGIEVVRVLHGSRNWTALFRGTP